MKNINKTPGFDEIIFENRNKSYGAYDLRKKYNTTASLSILGGVGLSLILFLLLSFSGTQDGNATAPPATVSIILDNSLIQKVEATPEKPVITNNQVIKNLPPQVTEDTSIKIDYIPTTEEIYKTTTNGIPSDSQIVAISTDPVIPKELEPRIFVQEMPEFPGGIPALMKYIGDNLKYPEEAAQNNLQGKVVLRFVVNSDGSSDRIEVTRGIDPLLDNEAIRVIKMLPKFKPGKQDGVPVPVWYSIPVSFKLESN